MTASLSVKAFGLGNYYTAHQATNLGLTFCIGVWGSEIGVPATPPSNITLAGIGLIFVFLGMLPIMFMEKSEAGPTPTKQDATETAKEENLTDYMPLSPRIPKTPTRTKLSDLFQSEDSAGQPTAAPREFQSGKFDFAPRSGDLDRLRSSSSRLLSVPLPSLTVPSPKRRNFLAMNAITWDGTIGREFALEAVNPPMSCLGDVSMVVKEEPEFDVFDGTEDPAQEPLLDQSESGRLSGGQWLFGMIMALVAGAMYAAMYVPQLVWKARLEAAGIHPTGFDYFFSLSVGLYLSSTLWLLCLGAWKRYRRKRIEKSVLRPALISGILYGCAALSFLYAMMVLPYAIGYAIGCGGGLAVSLIWGVFVFGEAASVHNRRCVLCSFIGILIGIILLGMAA
eukprot:TRINITY_DN94079_c0_g1_i1.p1 TRINITY_DN94079_c0_g1~~TRINITY_DN94079_c0_g1_i1.p1  ORF type:complete len:408 (+),score=64.35 TRINITY_DN94079_c0_g1_i1:40-1224(+)